MGGQKSFAFQAWIAFLRESQRDRQLQDAVEASRQKVQAFMGKQKEGAKSVLLRMTAATNSGLITSVLQAWSEVHAEEKKSAEVAKAMNAQSSKLSSFAFKKKETAAQASHRLSLLEDQSLLICCLSLWKQVTKIERMKRFGKEKSMRRMQELAGVKGAFRNFANELDETLNQATPRAASDGRNAII